jgi:hypothetical protein
VNTVGDERQVYLALSAAPTEAVKKAITYTYILVGMIRATRKWTGRIIRVNRPEIYVERDNEWAEGYAKLD